MQLKTGSAIVLQQLKLQLMPLKQLLQQLKKIRTF
jgi:hypothetical protein